jgi:undecaprenyl-diphosphatase
MILRRLLVLDAGLSNGLRVAEKPGALRTISAFFAHSGDSWFWGLGLVILWLAGAPAWKEWAILQLIGISSLAAAVMLTKFLVRRRRPEGEWGSIYRNADPHSFPSGHAARAFLIAVIATGAGPAWLAVVLWFWAPFVAAARIVMGLHYVSDVIAGMIIGSISGVLWLQAYPGVMAWLTAVLHFPAS